MKIYKGKICKKRATASDWQNQAMPNKHRVLPVGIRYTSAEFELISNGFIPQEMEDKWFIYRENDNIFFHRSWTGACIYVAHFVQDCDFWILQEVSTSEYIKKEDNQHIKVLNRLIDMLLNKGI